MRSGPEVETKIQELIDAMTLEEKVGMAHSESNFRSGGVQRLGVPPLCMSDGPHGVRQELSDDSWDPVDGVDDAITYLPVGTALAATWNPERAKDFGTVLGAEARARGKDVILGPGINIIRSPLCGRNFEYFGEDPYHISKLAVPLIQAVQEQDVATSVKHFALNNQEWNRFHVDVECDERTLREIYLPGFEAATVEGKAYTVMGAYNTFRGQHCCHHDYLLNKVLKEEWGYEYLVVSDWGGVHDTREAAENGLDIEMGGKLDNQYLDMPFLAGLKDGTYGESLVNEKVRRILRVMFAVGLFDEKRKPGAMNTPAHQAIAKRIADEALVLLQNRDEMLPLDPGSIKTLAVIGENADMAHAAGGGSSGLKTLYEITPLAGLREKLGDKVEIKYIKGYPSLPAGLSPIPTTCLTPMDSAGIGNWRFEVHDNRQRQGEPVHVECVPQIDFACEEVPVEGKGLRPTQWAARWLGKITPEVSGSYQLILHGADNFLLRIEGKVVATLWDVTAPATRIESMELEEGRSYNVELELHPKTPGGSLQFGWIVPGADLTRDEDPHAEAVALAASCDAVLFFGGSTHMEDCEGQDRKQFSLSGGQDELITRIAESNPKTAVFLNGGAAVAMPWADTVLAIAQTFYAGMEGGRAIADMILGNVNPSGKLPFTWPVQLEDYAAHSVSDYNPDNVTYNEEWRVGYRYTDADGPAPRYAFGHGLSYTSFSLSDAAVTTDCADGVAAVEVTVTNTGARAGAEVVQLYLTDEECSVARPPKELKGFAKIELAPGASEKVRMILAERDLSYYDVDRKGWVAEPGRFTAHLATSAAQIHASISFEYEPV